MNSNNLQNKAEETEILTADERKISEFVGSLERVSAPNDFEFRLKARIAEHGQEDYQTGYWQWIRYLLPIGVSALVLAFVLYGTNFFAPSQPADQIADAQPIKSAEIEIKPIETPSNTIVASSNSDKSEDFPVNSSGQNVSLPMGVEQKPVFVSEGTNLKKKEFPNKPIEDNGGGSRDSAVTTAPIQLSKGLNSNATVPSSQEFKNAGTTNIIGMLNVNGIEIISEGGKLKVKSIRQNSPAERAGVKIGDIIESFAEQKNDGNSNSSNPGGARKLTVSRDGELFTFDLKLN